MAFKPTLPGCPLLHISPASSVTQDAPNAARPKSLDVTNMVVRPVMACCLDARREGNSEQIPSASGRQRPWVTLMSYTIRKQSQRIRRMNKL